MASYTTQWRLEFPWPNADLCHLLFLIYRCISLRQTISRGPFSLMQPFSPNTGTGHLAAPNLCSNLRLQAGLTCDLGICAYAHTWRKNAPSSSNGNSITTVSSWSSASQKHCCSIPHRYLPLRGKLRISASYFPPLLLTQQWCLAWSVRSRNIQHYGARDITVSKVCV